VHVAITMAKACFATFMLACALYIIARQFSPISFPSGTIVAGVFILSTSVVLIVTLLAMSMIRSAEAAFVRYVSQNVGYTSTMILKRVIKAKTEVGLALMMITYLPGDYLIHFCFHFPPFGMCNHIVFGDVALYVFTKGVIFATDWNDSHAAKFRYHVYNVVSTLKILS